MQLKGIHVPGLDVTFSLYQLTRFEMICYVSQPGVTEVSTDNPYITFLYPGSLRMVRSSYEEDNVLDTPLGSNIVKRIRAEIIKLQAVDELVEETFYPSDD